MLPKFLQNNQDQVKKAEIIARCNEYACVLTDNVLEVEIEANEKFLLSSELEEIQKIQNEMVKNQNENRKTIHEQFDVLKKTLIC